MSSLRIPVTAQDHSTGPEDAKVVLVEYGDYQCPYCGAAYPVVKELLAEHGNQIRFIFRNFPLADVHAEAVDAAFVAEFAGEHGKYWEAHDLLFENQGRLGRTLYEEICTTLGLSLVELRTAAESRQYLARIQADEEGGIRNGVNGTPTFFLNGQRLDGGTAELPSAISAALGHDR